MTQIGELCVIQVELRADSDQMELIEPRRQTTQQDCLQTSQLTFKVQELLQAIKLTGKLQSSSFILAF
jgi:hypothetical protein